MTGFSRSPLLVNRCGRRKAYENLLDRARFRGISPNNSTPGRVFKTTQQSVAANEARSSILDFARQSGSGILNAGYHVISEISTEEYVFFYLEYSMDLGGDMQAPQNEYSRSKYPQQGS
jgi:hypothetical protein